MIVYVDSSLAGRVVLGQERQVSDWSAWDRAASSEILGVELRRALHRIRLERLRDDVWMADALTALVSLEDAIEQIAIDQTVLARASLPMPTVVKTLDAIHLASAQLFQEGIGERLVFATHDRQQAVAARALQFEVIGV